MSEIKETLEDIIKAHDSMFNQCCSNPIFDSWGKQINVGSLNDAFLKAQNALAELEVIITQRDIAWKELREIREAIKADENESTGDMVRFRMAELTMARHVLEDHGPEGHNVTNQQYVELRNEYNDAIRIWETTIMESVGEDGPGSVVEAINKIKAQRDELLAALKNVIDGNDLAHERGESLHSWPDSDFRRQAEKAIEAASQRQFVTREMALDAGDPSLEGQRL